MNTNEQNIEFKKIKRKHKVTKKLRLRKFLITLLVVVILIGVLVPVYYKLYVPNAAKNYYKETANKYGNALFVSTLPKDYNETFGALYRINSDVAGFLNIPGTVIDYPVVKISDKNDEKYYQNHLFNGRFNSYGTPYFTVQSNPLINEPDNTIIKANINLLNDISKYYDIDFYKQNPVLMMDTVFNEGFWKIIAVYNTDEDMSVTSIPETFNSKQDFEKYVKYATKNSAFTPCCDLDNSDKLLSLIGCGSDYSCVLVARKVRDGESISVDLSKIKSKTVGEDIKNLFNISSDFDGVDDILTNSKKYINESVSFDENYTNSSNYNFVDIGGGAPTLESLGDLFVKNAETGEIVKDSYLNVISSIVQYEVGDYQNVELSKAQAVATYSYLVYYNSSENNPVPVYMKSPTQNIIDAVSAVAGQILTYNTKPCCSLYFPVSAGVTTSCYDTYGKEFPYLQTVDSSNDISYNGFAYTISLSSNELKTLIKDKLNIDLSGPMANWIKILNYDESGKYVKSVSVGGNLTYGDNITITGKTISDVVFSGKLKSHSFEINFDSNKNRFLVTSYGKGSGVGMSQYGAYCLASAGGDYKSILNYYFPKSSIQYISYE